MKFIEDYLSGLFECQVFDVYLDYKASTEVLYCRGVGSLEYEAFAGRKFPISIEVTFSAISHNLPHNKGSLVMESKRTRSLNLSEYTYKCLQGKETTEMFEYLLGK